MIKKRPELKNARLSIVMPILNEAAVLPRLLADLKHVMQQVGCKWSLILVNDGSSDGSAELLDAMAFADRRLTVIHLSRNFGQQSAVQAGLESADGDAVILMDSDGQDDPTAIREMVRRWLAGDDVVYAVRYGRKENILRRFLLSSFYRILGRVASIPIPKDAGNFGLIDRRVADQIVDLQEFDRYFPGLRSWVGFKQSALRVERFARHDKLPRKSLRSLFALAKTALVGFSRVPLQVFYGLSCLSASACVVFVTFALFQLIMNGSNVPSWTWIAGTVSFFSAINTLGIAILGEYMCRIYDQVRKRPPFIVERTTNLPARRSTDLMDGGQRDSDSIVLSELNALRLEIERMQTPMRRSQDKKIMESIGSNGSSDKTSSTKSNSSPA